MICAIVLTVTRSPFHFVVVPMHDDWSVNDCRKPARARSIIESRVDASAWTASEGGLAAAAARSIPGSGVRRRLQGQHDEIEQGAAPRPETGSDRPFADAHLMGDLGWRLIQEFRATDDLGVKGIQQIDKRFDELSQVGLQIGLVEPVRVPGASAAAATVVSPADVPICRRAITVRPAGRRVLSPIARQGFRDLMPGSIRIKFVTTRDVAQA